MTEPVRDERLRERDLADELRIPVETVKGWRRRGVGPRSVKLVGVISYLRSDVDAWIAEQSARVAS